MADNDRDQRREEAKQSRDEINQKIDELRDLLVETGQMDENTANASLFAVRPAQVTLTGNYADLQRMGSIVVEGKISANALPSNHPQEEQETSNIEDAFAAPPDPINEDEALEQQGVSRATRNFQPGISGEEGAEAGAETSAETNGDKVNADTMTKQELLDTAASRGVTADDSMTKAEIVSAINKG